MVIPFGQIFVFVSFHVSKPTSGIPNITYCKTESKDRLKDIEEIYDLADFCIFVLVLQLKNATLSDLPAIMQVLEAGRDIMLASGNPNQWAKGYPTEEMVRGDIGLGYGKVMVEDGRIVAYFACIPSPDTT